MVSTGRGNLVSEDVITTNNHVEPQTVMDKLLFRGVTYARIMILSKVV